MNQIRSLGFQVVIAVFVSSLSLDVALAENIDPNNTGAQYAWGENVGWLNAEPDGDGGPGIEVTDSELTGYLWGENIGWISLSCLNTSNCETTPYGVLNNGAGVLSGSAWGENVGWINFAPDSIGVRIDPNTGIFSGHAWGENIGWINFDLAGLDNLPITTVWRAQNGQIAMPTLTIVKAGDGNGTVTSDPEGILCGTDCSFAFPAGTTMTLTAVPDSDAEFAGWNLDGCSGTDPCTFGLSESQTITATFTLAAIDVNTVTNLSITKTFSPTLTSEGYIEYLLKIQNQGPDTAAGVGITDVLPDSVVFIGALGPEGTTCEITSGTITCVLGTMEPGATVNIALVVQPTALGTLTNTVTVAATTFDPDTTNDSATLVVELSLARVTLTVIPEGQGRVTSEPEGIQCPPVCSAEFDAGTDVTLTAAPDPNFALTEWAGADCPETEPCSFRMDFSGSITATFSPTIALPDLTGILTKLKHVVRDTGDRLVIKVLVQNAGDTALANGGQVAVWASNDAILDDGDTLLVAQPFGAEDLTPGGTVGVKLKTNVLGALAGQFAIIVLDDLNQVDEGNELNNTIVQRIGGRGCVKDTFIVDREPSSQGSPTNAGKIKASNCVTVVGETENSIDVDAFRLRAKGNQTIQITRTQSSQADVTLSVFDEQGQQLGGCIEPDRCIITVFGLEPTEIVPLVIVVSPSQTAGSYALDVISVP